MYAHYFKHGKTHQLVISIDSSPVGKTVKVDSKKAALKFAKDNNLTPWNF